MNFYPHRTVEEQANRLPEDFQSDYERTQLDRIEIDGELIQGYFEYSFLEEKSYVTQPVRTQDGSIYGIDDYMTFLTPRLIIKYTMMNIDDYRKLMKLLRDKNSFNVSCYDIVEDKRVTHEMYVAPMQMPVIYQQYLKVLGIQEPTIELIGTNNTPKLRVRYYANNGSPFYEEIKYNRVEYVTIPTAVLTSEGLVEGFSYFSTNADGTGFKYYSGDTILFPETTEGLNLYAQWG